MHRDPCVATARRNGREHRDRGERSSRSRSRVSITCAPASARATTGFARSAQARRRQRRQSPRTPQSAGFHSWAIASAIERGTRCVTKSRGLRKPGALDRHPPLPPAARDASPGPRLEQIHGDQAEWRVRESRDAPTNQPRRGRATRPDQHRWSASYWRCRRSGWSAPAVRSPCGSRRRNNFGQDCEGARDLPGVSTSTAPRRATPTPIPTINAPRRSIVVNPLDDQYPAPCILKTMTPELFFCSAGSRARTTWPMRADRGAIAWQNMSTSRGMDMMAGWLRTLLVIGAVFAGARAQAVEPSNTILTINPIVLRDNAQDKDTALRITLPMAGGRMPIILFSTVPSTPRTIICR